MTAIDAAHQGFHCLADDDWFCLALHVYSVCVGGDGECGEWGVSVRSCD